ncbi:sulfatase-like hydrolase/transferase [Nitrincola tapanii]|nr:sulfatase-like hydrolase/transferase [Nitrincola tapanii]
MKVLVDESVSLRNVTFSALYFLIPNIIAWAVSDYVSVQRPYVNIDYAYPAILLVLGYCKTSVILFFSVFLIDLFAIIGQVFVFFRISDIFIWMSFLPSAPFVYKVIVFLGSLLVLILAFLSIFFGKRSHKLFVLVVANCLIFMNLYAVLLVASPEKRIMHWRMDSDIYLYSQADFFIRYRFTRFFDMVRGDGQIFDEYTDDALSDRVYQAIDEGVLSDKILFIVAESWGATKNPFINKDVISSIEQLQSRSVEMGSFRFASSATVAGEFRELCGLKPLHYNFKKIEEGLDDCLPSKLNQLGYRTKSLHGAVSSMYDRRHWYPRVGFDASLFFNSQVWSRRCYSWPGVCDRDFLPIVEDFFRSDNKGFLYWLTLNSHSIYDLRDLHVDTFDCVLYGIPSGIETCRNLKLHKQFFDNLSELLDREDMHEVEVYVVSDHHPIIFDREEFDNYFERDVIPWIRISKKDSSTVGAYTSMLN